MTKPRQSASIGVLLLAAPLAVVLFGVWFWLGAAAAAAHATLERSEPASGARIGVEPRQVVLFFDEPVRLALGNVTVAGPGGAHVDAGRVVGDGGRSVTVALRPGAGDGAYAVSYRVISLDGHPVAGGFFFRVGAGAVPAAAIPVTSGSAPEDTTVRAVYAGCRYAGFVGLLLLAGGAVFLVLLWPAGVPRRRVVGQIWLGYGLVTAATMGELVLQVPYAAGVPLTGITGAGFDDVLDTTFGTAHLVRLALLALAVPVLLAMVKRPPGGTAPPVRPARWAIASAVALGAGLVVTWAYSGHAVATVPAVSLPSDAVHLAAIAVWIGGLVVLATALLPVAGGGELRVALPRWSALAMVCVAALIVSGSVQTLLEVGSWSGLVDTTYGQLVLVKVGLLAAVLAVANCSRRWVNRWCAGVPAAAPARVDVRRLRRGVAAETLLAAVAVAVAAMLIEAAPGRSAPATPPAAAAARPITRHGAYRATVRRGDVIMHLKVDPAVVGVQYIYLAANRPDGHRLDVRQWTLTVSNDELGLDHVNVPVLIDSGVGHYFVYGSFTMAVGGTWRIQVTAHTGDVDETVMTRTVRVRS